MASSKVTCWRVVYQNCRGKLHLDLLELDIDDSGAVMMLKLRERYWHVRSHAPFSFIERWFPIWTPAVETAILSANSNIDLEAQQRHQQVFVVQRVRNIELAEAFHSPQVLSTATTFVKNNSHFGNSTSFGKPGKDVIFIALQWNYIGLATLLIVNLLLCSVPGILVGTLTGSADLGVAVASGIASILSCLTAILFLAWKRDM